MSDRFVVFIFLVLVNLPASLWAQTILKNSAKSNAKESEKIKDYGYKYPKSTDKEYSQASELMIEACQRFQVKLSKISTTRSKKENEVHDEKNKNQFYELCSCLARDIAEAKDIHEVQVLEAHFLGKELPNSVFADDPEIGDIFDERPDYLQYANSVLSKCDKN